jgi:hypothetical protein
MIMQNLEILKLVMILVKKIYLGREGSFAKGGLVRSGKPKIAKKGWR